MTEARALASRRPTPGITIRQVRGASYPPLTGPSRGGRGLSAANGSGIAAPAVSVPVQVPPGAAAAANERNPVGVATPHPSSDSAAGNAAVGEGGGQSKKTAASPAGSPQSREAQRLALFDRLLGVDVVDLVKLRGACWSGIPPQHRATCWQLLLGYLPSNREWREETLQRKRREYWESVPQYFDVDDTERSQYQRETLHQILMDVPRTSPSSRTFHHEVVQRALERILYIWALRHPASGYVQGINDLVTPFFMAHLPQGGRPHTMEDVDAVAPIELAQVEADAYWCLSKLLDTIQDHYTFAQPGIQRMVFKLKEIVARIDTPLHNHLAEQGLAFIQFAFRWMNCLTVGFGIPSERLRLLQLAGLLMRELSLDLILRVWDTYLSESGADAAEETAIITTSATSSEGFAVLHVYMCASLLVRWSADLQQMDFQELVMFLQHLPTSGWSSTDVGELLSQAFVYRSLYHNAPSHLKQTSSGVPT